MPATHQSLPRRRIETPRLILRCWEPADASLLKDAIDGSLPELRRFTPWVIPEPDEVDVLEARLHRFRDQFANAQNFIYGIFAPSETRVLGQAGLYGRVGPDALEIGYWIRSDVTGRGYASEAARALTHVAFVECGVQRVEIRCEPDNAASAAIPLRLNYKLRELLLEDPPAVGNEPRQLQVWEQLSAEYLTSTQHIQG